jgi:hypothetical protein
VNQSLQQTTAVGCILFLVLAAGANTDDESISLQINYGTEKNGRISQRINKFCP